MDAYATSSMRSCLRPRHCRHCSPSSTRPGHIRTLPGRPVDPDLAALTGHRHQAQIVAPVEVDTAGDDRFTLQIVVAYCNGKTQQEIASSYGVHVQTVRKRLRDAGVMVRDHLAVLTRGEIATIQTEHANGTSARELGRRYSVAHTTILRHLHRPQSGNEVTPTRLRAVASATLCNDTSPSRTTAPPTIHHGAPKKIDADQERCAATRMHTTRNEVPPQGLEP